MKFEYKCLQISEKELDIEDIGNVAIEASRDDYYSYLVIRTSMGSTLIMEYGRIVPDIDKLPPHVSCSFDRIDYKEVAIIKRIEKFLASAENAEIIPAQVALDRCISIIKYMKDERNY